MIRKERNKSITETGPTEKIVIDKCCKIRRFVTGAVAYTALLFNYCLAKLTVRYRFAP